MRGANRVRCWRNLCWLAGIGSGFVLCSLASAASPPFKITSTLDGHSVLPHRIHWLAFPRVPASTKVKVEFLIDGKVLWAERDVPYTFAEDGGYLVTSWLTPGKHRFTVRATVVRIGDTIVKDGQVAEDTVVATVLRAPDPPAALAGTWQRTPDTTGHPTFPKGTYKIIFERRWIQERFPGKFDPVTTHANGPGTGQGLIEDNDWDPHATTFHVENAVVYKRFDRNDPEGGSPCDPGQGTDYSWSVEGDTLTLTPVGGKDPCAGRGFLWTGEWTRVH
jgi:hypothetical protein